MVGVNRMTDHMGNNQIKKRAAEAFNKKRREAHVERVRIAQDKIDNPEKYKSSRRSVRKAQMFIAATAAMAISPTAFDDRLLG